MDTGTTPPATEVVPFDEMLLPDGTPRDAHSAMFETLSSLGSDGLAERARQRDAYLDRQGITFTLGERERPLPMDLVPRVLTPPEWKQIEAGRHPAHPGARGVPRRRLRRRPGARGRHHPAPARDHVDALPPRRPGASSRRTACASTWPASTSSATRPASSACSRTTCATPPASPTCWRTAGPWRTCCPRSSPTIACAPVDEYPERLLDALQAAAPPGIERPDRRGAHPGRAQLRPLRARVPGPAHGRRARRGPRPVLPRRRRCGCAPRRGPEPVHVIYRRIDDDFLDPLHFRARLACSASPGSLNAARAGTSRSPTRSATASPTTRRSTPTCPTSSATTSARSRSCPTSTPTTCRTPTSATYVLDRLDRMVVKPVDGSGGYGLVIGPRATDERARR